MVQQQRNVNVDSANTHLLFPVHQHEKDAMEQAFSDHQWVHLFSKITFIMGGQHFLVVSLGSEHKLR